MLGREQMGIETYKGLQDKIQHTSSIQRSTIEPKKKIDHTDIQATHTAKCPQPNCIMRASPNL